MSRRVQRRKPPAPTAVAPPQPPDTAARWITAVLALLVIAVFAQTLGHSFTNYDDGQIIYENPHVREGLTPPSVAWAVTSTSLGYYPLTWLSHMLDVTLWGLRPAGHFATAILLHLASTIVLFLALRRMAGATYRPAFVAALFAIHPMHVESVAWVSERKDTLSTFFGFVALAAYGWHGRVRSRRQNVIVFLAFLASLLAKQMLVTLPFLLLLLDYWPLERLNRRTIVEKIPLFGLTLAGAVVAVAGQRQLSAIQPVSTTPISLRIANALSGYVRYLEKLVWPVDLSIFYPLERVPTAYAAGAAAVLLAITAAAWVLRRRAPYFIVGWLWYLGTLVPVIGIVQIGSQSIADHYTYVPFVGLFIAIIWGAADLANRVAVPVKAVAIAGAVAVVVLACVAWKQTRYWRDSVTVWQHALAVTPSNIIAEYTYGQALELTNPDEALDHLHRAAAMMADSTRKATTSIPRPMVAQCQVGIGTALLIKARATTDAPTQLRLIDEAVKAYSSALAIDPAAGNAQRNLQRAKLMREQVPQPTMTSFIDQGFPLLRAGRPSEAAEKFRQAVQVGPSSITPRIYLALALIQAQRKSEARAELEQVRRMDPQLGNEYITRALRLPPASSNLDNVIKSLQQ